MGTSGRGSVGTSGRGSVGGDGSVGAMNRGSIRGSPTESSRRISKGGERGSDTENEAEAGRVMEEMAREVASRVLEEGTRCLLWERPQGLQVGVCWQATGGVAGGVAFRVSRGTGEGADRTQTAVAGEVRGDSAERARAVATTTPSEGETTDGVVCGQAPKLLCGGCMPVLCPARRLRQKDERITLPVGLAWPPKGSAAMSADIKLLYTELSNDYHCYCSFVLCRDVQPFEPFYRCGIV